MSTLRLRPETKQLLDLYKDEIKGEYFTLALFLDSAVRSRLRGMGYPVEQDSVVKHIIKLQKSKARHIDQLAVSRTLKRHRDRIRIAVERLNDPSKLI